MNDISPHFKREEFACNDECGFDTVDVELVEVVEDVRAHFGKPVTVNSGCRCQIHNAFVGGEDHSKHLLGIASDIVVKDVSPSDVYVYLNRKYPHTYGIGHYETFTHIDVRSNRARW